MRIVLPPAPVQLRAQQIEQPMQAAKRDGGATPGSGGKIGFAHIVARIANDAVGAGRNSSEVHLPCHRGSHSGEARRQWRHALRAVEIDQQQACRAMILRRHHGMGDVPGARADGS